MKLLLKQQLPLMMAKKAINATTTVTATTAIVEEKMEE